MTLEEIKAEMKLRRKKKIHPKVALKKEKRRGQLVKFISFSNKKH